MLCEFENSLLEEHDVVGGGRRAERENFTRHAPQSMQQDIFFYCCVPSLLYVCAWRYARVCVPLCIIIISLVQSFATFRLVWFGFVLVFIILLFFDCLHTAPFINNSQWFLLFFFSFSWFFAVRKSPCLSYISLYFFYTLLFALWWLGLLDSHVNNWKNPIGKR